MTISRVQMKGRKGFTLIELLIVIAIIALLVSLISAAVVYAIRMGHRTQNRVDIGQLDAAMETFKTKFGATPPSRIKLCERLGYYDLTTNPVTGQPTNRLDTDSVAFLSQMFPRLDWTYGIDWNGNGIIDPFPSPPLVPGQDGGGAVTLEGDQCLVFFLGGIPNAPGQQLNCLGFSSDPRNPASITQDRIGPFFDFQTRRLAQLRVGANFYNTYYSYLDTYGAPYAYFSSYKQPNNYNRYLFFAPPPYPLLSPVRFDQSDCFSLGVCPYYDSQTPIGVKYLFPNRFQIISAGANNAFGIGGGPVFGLPGGPWTTGTASILYPDGSAGFDDQANFTSGLLSAGPN